jgi:hypothetical protein
MAASGMYQNLASRNGLPAIGELVSRVLLSSSISLWILADARQRGRPMPYDAGTFFYFAWPVLAPVYLFKTRGWRAFAVLSWFALLFGAAQILSQLPSMFVK